MDISPDKQNIDRVFSNTSYFIDFYQRDYKWNEEPVKRLLDDIFYKFNLEFENNKKLDPNKEIITEKYSWYYLSTYVTNTVAGKVFIVDGQQRLTTLSLILIKLFHLSKHYSSKLTKWLEGKIAGHSGFENEFWMNHTKHKSTQEELLNGEKALQDIDTSQGITAQNLVNNYSVISKNIDKSLDSQQKFETFCFYFLYRIVLINLSVEQTDVPMVFEVINDRGVSLKPYEIIKGKLLGQINKVELEKDDYNGLWENQVNDINDFYEDEIDDFFRQYLKAKLSDTRKDGQRFDGDYHREIFSENVNGKLHLNHNESGVKSFLNNEFKYFTSLHIKILKYYDSYDDNQPYVYFNRLNDLDGQFLLIHSACKLNDEEDDEKIKAISFELDRLFSLLQLQNCYDSNKFTEITYSISSEIRDGNLSELRKVFDKYLFKIIGENRSVRVAMPFTYSYFKNTGINLNMRFKRYFFTRIEKFLSENMNLNMKHFIGDLVSKTGAKTGFHIEHILSYNDENLSFFDNDEELFERERNRLGGILLLKGKDNISSNNEVYANKLKTYANTLYWNETLREDSYKSKLDMNSLKKKYKLELEPYLKFGQEELESRHKLLSKISTILWNAESEEKVL